MTWIDIQDQKQVDDAIGKLRTREPRYIDDYACGDPRFGLWLRLVDIRMGHAVGVTHRDIADWQWRDSFDSGDSPTAAAVEALRADDTFSAFVESRGL